MHIKVDEDLPKAVVQLLIDHGHEATNVFQQRMSGWFDSALWNVIQKEHRFLVTADKGFADIRLYPPGAHMGVLLLRPDQDGIRPTLELLEKVLEKYNLNDLQGMTSVVTPRGIRIRRPDR